MSKNLDQIYEVNPITSNASTDLMYFMQSPYTPGTDAGMTYENFSAQFGTPYTASALISNNDNNVTLTLGGTPSTALLEAVSLTLGWTGELSLARGGTNANLTASNGGIVYSGSSALAILAGTATADQIILSGSSTTPSWSTATYLATMTANELLYASSSNTMGQITTANNGVLITSNSGVPSFLANGTANYVLTANSAAPPSWQSVSASGAITTIDGDSGTVAPSSGVITISGGSTGLTTSGSSATLDLTGTLKLANGGTNASLTASNGGIFYSTASAGAILAGTSTANQVLLSGSSTTPAWSTATYPVTTTVNQILYSSSANTIAGLTTADNGVLITSSGGVPSIGTTLPTQVQTNITELGTITTGVWHGTVVAGQYGGTGVANTGLTITLGGGAAGLVLTSDSSGNATWQSSTSVIWAANSNSSINAAVGNGYVLTSGSATTVTLPTTFAVGAMIGIQGQGAAWTVDIGSGTNVQNWGNTYSTSIASTNNTDYLLLLATVANTTWSIVAMTTTGFTAS